MSCFNLSICVRVRVSNGNVQYFKRKSTVLKNLEAPAYIHQYQLSIAPDIIPERTHLEKSSRQHFEHRAQVQLFFRGERMWIEECWEGNCGG
jgi:hypothetical protein